MKMNIHKEVNPLAKLKKAMWFLVYDTLLSKKEHVEITYMYGVIT